MKGYFHKKSGNLEFYIKEGFEDLIKIFKNFEELREKYRRKTFISNPNLVEMWDIPNVGKVVIKKFGWRSRIHYLLSPFMNSKAQTSFQNALHLLENGVKTPEPLAVFTERKRNFVINNVFVTRYIGEHTTLRRELERWRKRGELPEDLLEEAAIYVRRMHDSGFFHRDLTLENFLMVDGERGFYIVDLNRGRRRMYPLMRAQDIAKMDLEESELKIFLKHYGAPGLFSKLVFLLKRKESLVQRLKRFRKSLLRLTGRLF